MAAVIGKDSVMAQLVAQRLEIIKRHMPYTLACIEDRAQHFGNEAYALVRRGLRGEPGCFYAIEGGHVVGQPRGLELKGQADFIVVFGCAHMCIWPEHVWKASATPEGEGGGDGAA